jgi:putative ABC transport system permease protein
VRAPYPFGADDANLVLVKVNREQLQDVVEKVTALVGKKGVVSSELSMRQALSGVLFLSQSMGLIIAAIIGLFAAAFVWRATATSVAERRREMAILQAIGWSRRHIGEQVVIENLALAVIGTAAGIAVALVVVLALGHVSVTFDLPWDLSSTPHFIPQATINRTQTITAPLSISWATAGIAGAGSLAISLLAVLAVLALPRPQPWSLLRAE